ncbi:MAG: amidohydrolase family protein [Deltaproteobacteria bacterium]|nr:amidohydrolase family protein [Deltaproteobacteria bacterium]
MGDKKVNVAKKGLIKDDYFKIDCEAHLSGDKTRIDYYPGVQLWWKGVDGTRRAFGASEKRKVSEIRDKGERKTPEEDKLIEYMDRYGVDLACVLPESMMDTTGYAARWSTNGYVAAACEKYPDRFLFQCNVGPILKRGMKHVLWELEYLVKERNCKLVKFYPPEDTYINDKDIWPFYEKVAELGVPLTVHTGFSWCPPGKAKYCVPILLDEVATDFPDLSIIAFHAGWPYCHDLNMVALTHPNICISLSLLMPWWHNAPWRLAEIIGEAIQFAGEGRVVWGSDFFGAGGLIRSAVDALRDFEMPEELQQRYGFAPVTEGVKRKIFGENLARLLEIEPKRRISN